MAKTREDILTDAAIKFAQAYWDRVANRRDENGNPTAPMVPAEKQAFAKGEDAYVDWMAKAMYAKMAADPEYSAENWNEAKAERLEKFDDYKGALYAIQGGPSPEAAHEQKMFATFYPYIKDGAWYNMSPKAITALMNSPEFGYDSSNEKSRQQFWDDLTKYDLLYQRGKIVDEFANSGWGIANALISPTAYQEGIKQALTGEFDDDAMRNAVMLDQGVNTAIATVPGFGLARASRGARVPFAVPELFSKELLPGASTPLSGAYQAGAEAFRQYGKGPIVDKELEADPSAVMVTGVAGAGTPQLADMASTGLQKLQAPWARQMGRGLSRGARGFDPVDKEKNALKEMLLRARQYSIDANKKAAEAVASGASAEPRLWQYGPSGRMALQNYNTALEKLEALNIYPKAKWETLGMPEIRKTTSQAVREIREAADDAFYTNPELNVKLHDIANGIEGAELTQEAIQQALKGEKFFEGPFAWNGKPVFAEDIVGATPHMSRGISLTFKAPDKNMVDAALHAYDTQPFQFFEVSNAPGLVTNASVEANEQLAQKMLGMFPAKYAAQEAAEGMTPSMRFGFAGGRAAGNVLGTVGGIVEPTVGVGAREGADMVRNSLTGAPASQRQEFWKNQAWYQDMPEDKREAFDKAMNDVYKERRKRKKGK